MKEVLACHLVVDSYDVLRGDAKINEPDFQIGKDWVEITYSERNAQHDMKKHNQHQKSSTITDFFDEVQSAIQSKSEKKYCVAEKSVGILSLFDITPFCIEENHNMLDELICQSRDSFFESLLDRYIDTGIFENIYIVSIGYDRTFILFDLVKFKKYEDFIHVIGVPEGMNIPCRTRMEVTNNETTI